MAAGAQECGERCNGQGGEEQETLVGPVPAHVHTSIALVLLASRWSGPELPCSSRNGGDARADAEDAVARGKRRGAARGETVVVKGQWRGSAEEERMAVAARNGEAREEETGAAKGNGEGAGQRGTRLSLKGRCGGRKGRQLFGPRGAAAAAKGRDKRLEGQR